MVDIVVGVDASTSSALALRWALEEARLHNSGVRAVLALPGGRLPSAVERAAEPSDLGDPTAAAVRVLHRLVMEATLARAHEALRPTGETSLVSSTPVGETTLVSETVVRALPADALLRASATAHMLVVGAPGHSRPRRACAGSLAEVCARQARVPVVTARSSRAPAWVRTIFRSDTTAPGGFERTGRSYPAGPGYFARITLPDQAAPCLLVP